MKHRTKWISSISAAVIVTGLILPARQARGAAVLWSSGTGSTGHCYEVVSAPSGITWDSAQADAISRGGYLATITSAEENDFVFGLVDSPTYWVVEAGTVANLGPWLGGYQPDGSVEPDGGWTWVNRDGPFAFTNWHASEPSDGVGSPHGLQESRLHYFEYSGRSSKWNDLPPSGSFTHPIAYVVEYDSKPIVYSAAAQAPMNADGSSMFKASRGALPVKFALAVNGTPTCDMPPATIALARATGGGDVTVNESEFILPSDAGSSFRIDSTTCQYVYNLSASSLGPGTYVAHISIGGNWVGVARFALR